MELRLDRPGVIVENIHLGDSLMTLCYRIKDSEPMSDIREAVSED
jgi:hypothetical protein